MLGTIIMNGHAPVCVYLCKWDISEGYKCMGNLYEKYYGLLTLGGWQNARGC